MQDTSITWADWTWNPVRGCSRISPGCVNCYAEVDMARKNTNPKVPGCHGFAEFRIVGSKREAHWTGKVELQEHKLLEPLSWRKKALKFAGKNGRKPTCFVNSMSDLFHRELLVMDIDQVFGVMALCPGIDFLALTKRADRMEEWYDAPYDGCQHSVESRMREIDSSNPGIIDWPLHNVRLGVSVEDQKRADERIPHLINLDKYGWKTMISAEPLLEEIRLPLDRLKNSWCIVGGESGPGARPFDLAWARDLRDQCREAGVPYFFKQAGSNPVEQCIQYGHGPWGPAKEGVGERSIKFKARNGDDPIEWPEDLRVQEVPK